VQLKIGGGQGGGVQGLSKKRATHNPVIDHNFHIKLAIKSGIPHFSTTPDETNQVDSFGLPPESGTVISYSNDTLPIKQLKDFGGTRALSL